MDNMRQSEYDIKALNKDLIQSITKTKKHIEITENYIENLKKEIIYVEYNIESILSDLKKQLSKYIKQLACSHKKTYINENWNYHNNYIESEEITCKDCELILYEKQ